MNFSDILLNVLCSPFVTNYKKKQNENILRLHKCVERNVMSTYTMSDFYKNKIFLYVTGPIRMNKTNLSAENTTVHR